MKINFENNPKILNDFLNYLISAKGYSMQTVRRYNIILLNFFTFLKKYQEIAIDVKDFNYFILASVLESDIIAFLVYSRSSNKNTPETTRIKISVIRNFYKWLFLTKPGGYSKINPTQKLQCKGRSKRLPKYLTLNDAKKIQTIFNRKNCKYPIRNNTIITFLLSSGIRVGELVSLNLQDINFNNNTVIIRHGKGNIERTAFFSNNCKKQLLEYLKIRQNNVKTDSLFLNNKDMRIGIQAVEGICKKAYRLLNLEDKGYTVHTLRHTAATIMYMYNNQDILLVKEFLGHKSINSTQIYTEVYNEKIKEAFDKNPLINIA